MSRICVVDDKPLLRDSLKETLSREDHAVETFENPTEALEPVVRGEFDLVLSDLKMPRMDGVTFLRTLRDRGCETPVILMTAFGSISSAVEAMKLGAFDYIQKPFEADAIVVQVERALQHGRLRSENEALRASLDDMRRRREMVGDSEEMLAIRRQIARVARSDATVLIVGESGTGKELVATAIHAQSARADRPMLCLNCAALSGNLLESELFGHERGAFTGADRLRKGRFELADGGTLLLDEISEMALPLQAKLLRVLQEGEFERVGSSATRRANVRVIATTNRDLDDWVARHRFRGDLFYRLNVLPVHLPPLRSRGSDIRRLVDHFLKEAAARDGHKPPKVSPDAYRLLEEYRWPGNVRELENLCQRASVLAPDGLLTCDVIRGWLQGHVESASPFGDLQPGRMLEEMERRLIEKVLAENSGHRQRTARMLGMGVRTLGMKLKQWREEAESERTATRRTGLEPALTA